jgi:HAD superfamily hydrolase (TIGR01549 family)
MAISALLVDLDGTLWDSAPWLASLLAEGDEGVAGQLTSDLRNPEGGVRAANVVKERMTPAGFATACERSETILNLYPGASESLERCSQHVPLGVVTSLPAWMVEPMLKKVELDSTFEVVQCARWGMPSKPHPAGINRVIAQLGVDCGEAVYMGDTEVDRLAAEAAQVSFYWAGWGYGSIDAAGVQCLSSWRDLEALV